MSSERVKPRIPVVELSGEKVKAGSDSWDAACAQVRKALEKYGCFELVYDEHSIEKHNTIVEATEELFIVPDEIKTKHVNLSYGHGYVGKSSYLPLYESVRIQNAIDKQECQNFTHLMWPQGNQPFCYGIEIEYSEAQLKLITYLMVFIKYERSNQANTNMGLGGHTDTSFLSILHQNHINGLEIRIEDGEDHHWVPYKPSSHSSFIVLAADACLGWSNGRIKPCYHRVTVESEEVRYSIGVFSFLKGLIKAPKEFVDEEHPLKYKPFEHQQYLDFHSSFNGPTKYGIDVLKAFCGI